MLQLTGIAGGQELAAIRGLKPLSPVRFSGGPRKTWANGASIAGEPEKPKELTIPLRFTSFSTLGELQGPGVLT